MACINCDTAAMLFNDAAPYISLFLWGVSIASFWFVIRSQITPAYADFIVSLFMVTIILALGCLTIYLFKYHVDLVDATFNDGI